MDNEHLICSLCSERYVRPRMTACSHTFCEQCLFTFVFKSQRKSISCPSHGNETARFIECPACNNEITFSLEVVTQQWIIDTFPLDRQMLQCMGSQTESAISVDNMSTCDSQIERQVEERVVTCAPCQGTETECHAVKFCINCCEPLCKVCSEWHNKFKLFKTHTVVDLNASDLFQSQSSTDMFEQYMKCKIHTDNSIVSFCSNHRCLCCLKCITDKHRMCDLLQTADMGQQTKKRTDIVKDMYKHAYEHSNLLVKLKIDNDVSLNSSFDEISRKMQAMKLEIVRNIDKLFDGITETMKAIRMQIDKRGSDENTVDEMKDMFEKKLQYLQQVEDCTSIEHVFILSQAMKHEFIELEQKLQAYDASVKGSHISLKVCDDLLRFKDMTMCSEGVIDVKLEEIALEHRAYEEIKDLIHDYRVTNMPAIGIHIPSINSPTFSSISNCEECLLVCDSSSYSLCSYDLTNQLYDCISLSKAFNAVHIDSQRILVSRPETQTMAMVGYTNGKHFTKRSWKLGVTPVGIVCLSNNRCVVSTLNPNGFLFTSIIGYELRTSKHLTHVKSGEELRIADYFTIDEKRERLVMSCQDDKEIECISLDGESIFRYSSEDLECPQGIALDTYGNIYVCNHSYFSPSIVVLSPNGILQHHITDGVPRKPMAICSDKAGKRFWLTSNYIESGSSLYGFNLVKFSES